MISSLLWHSKIFILNLAIYQVYVSDTKSSLLSKSLMISCKYVHTQMLKDQDKLDY